MSKLQKQITVESPISKWEEIWTAQDFQEHEADFQEILSEYKWMRENYPNAIVARMRWLEKKKAVRVEVEKDWEGKDFYKEYANPETYAMYSAMFSKFTEWLSFREKRNIWIWPEDSMLGRGFVKQHFPSRKNLAEGMKIQLNETEKELGEMSDDILNKW